MSKPSSELSDVFVILAEGRIFLEHKTKEGTWIMCIFVPGESPEVTFRALPPDHKYVGEPVTTFLGKTLDEKDAKVVLNITKAFRLYVGEILPHLESVNSLLRWTPLLS